MIRFTLNGRPAEFDVESDMPLLWALRDELKMTGTKFGCGKGFCGACTVLLDGNAVRSCSFPASAAEGKSVTTIEGIHENGPHPVQEAWLEADLPQCGYCQPGQIMSAVALLNQNPSPSKSEIAENMTNLCRCGTYEKIRNAVTAAAEKMNRRSQGKQ